MDIRANVRRLLKRSRSSGQTKQSCDAQSTPKPKVNPPVLSRPDNVHLPQTTQVQQPGVHNSDPQSPTYINTQAVGYESDGKSAETLAHTDPRGFELAAAEQTRVKQEHIDELDNKPALILQQPTPTSEHLESPGLLGGPAENVDLSSTNSDYQSSYGTPCIDSERSSEPHLISESAISPGILPPAEHPPQSDLRRQSIASEENASRLEDLLQPDSAKTVPPSVQGDNSTTPPEPTLQPVSPTTGASYTRVVAKMQRKIWVKRPGASATMVAVREDDLVDDVRDKVLQKYANSLGRTFDAPDVTVRIVARAEGQRPLQERLLAPEEEMCRALDTYYPGGQTVDEALIIDIPPKRTPKPSPRQHHNAAYHILDEFRPQESGTDYFPPMPVIQQPGNTQVGILHDPRNPQPHVLHLPEHNRSISVLQTGQVPPLPSPGAASRRNRPKYGRQHTSSPTILAHGPASAAVPVHAPNLTAPQHLPHRPSARHRSDSNGSERPNGVPAAPPLPTPPAPEAPPTAKTASTPPTPGVRDHVLNRLSRPRKNRKATPTNGTATVKAGTNPSLHSLLDGSVPPINVLIVEDNMINLKLLEAFMKRLKVRWSTAMNGQIAVNKWRSGGFHLVLMDIQLPIMSGLEATKEIRRLERVNGIGVFSSSGPPTPMARSASESTVDHLNDQEKQAEDKERDKERDKLTLDEGLFKSPVIIVALTASSLQSDRHEALTAGCNDFLTKPVNFVWLERKVKEWGCMQALIDFDGWRKWKDFSNPDVDAKGKAVGGKSPLLDGLGKADIAAKAKAKQAKRDKRVSTEVSSSNNNRNTSLEHTNGLTDVGA